MNASRGKITMGVGRGIKACPARHCRPSTVASLLAKQTNPRLDIFSFASDVAAGGRAGGDDASRRLPSTNAANYALHGELARRRLRKCFGWDAGCFRRRRGCTHSRPS